MKKQGAILRQNVGIDVSKHKFDACITTIDIEGNISYKKSKKFNNNPEGYIKFLSWVEKEKNPALSVTFTLESTGVYHEGLAYFLHEKGQKISVLLPNIVKKFIQSLNIKSKTDKIDAKVLGRIGVERVLPLWKLSSKIYRELRKLTRERERLIGLRSRLKGYLEGEVHSGEPMDNIILRINILIESINKQIKDIEQELKEKVSSDAYVSERLSKVLTIPGVGFITAVTIIAETQGFDNFTSLRQLWSYAGYDVQQKQSGKYKGKTKISKKGNSHIRRAMYGPAMAIIRCSQTYKRFYEELVERKGNKMLALTAVQRKVLGLIRTLLKNNTEFIENYEEVKRNKENDTEQSNQETNVSTQNKYNDLNNNYPDKQASEQSNQETNKQDEENNNLAAKSSPSKKNNTNSSYNYRQIKTGSRSRTAPTTQDRQLNKKSCLPSAFAKIIKVRE